MIHICGVVVRRSKQRAKFDIQALAASFAVQARAIVGDAPKAIAPQLDAACGKLQAAPSIQNLQDTVRADHERSIEDLIALTEIEAPPFKEGPKVLLLAHRDTVFSSGAGVKVKRRGVRHLFAAHKDIDGMVGMEPVIPGNLLMQGVGSLRGEVAFKGPGGKNPVDSPIPQAAARASRYSGYSGRSAYRVLPSGGCQRVQVLAKAREGRTLQ